MAAANTDWATKGHLIQSLYERSQKDAWVIGMLYTNLVLAGHRELAVVALDGGEMEGQWERERIEGERYATGTIIEPPPARLL